MRIFALAFLFISVLSTATAQTAEFNNSFQLQDGIYTTHEELLTNNPAFPNCILKTNNATQDVNINGLKYSKIGNENYEKVYNAKLFATVQNGKLSIYYQKKLIPIYLKGTLCRFIYTRLVSQGSSSNNTQNSEFKSDICVFDIQSGEIYKLTKENLGRSISRDASLYTTYAKIKPGKKNKNLFKYITDFNTRNPTNIAVKEQPAITEE